MTGVAFQAPSNENISKIEFCRCNGISCKCNEKTSLKTKPPNFLLNGIWPLVFSKSHSKKNAFVFKKGVHLSFSKDIHCQRFYNLPVLHFQTRLALYRPNFRLKESTEKECFHQKCVSNLISTKHLLLWEHDFLAWLENSNTESVLTKCYAELQFWKYFCIVNHFDCVIFSVPISFISNLHNCLSSETISKMSYNFLVIRLLSLMLLLQLSIEDCP